MKLAINVQAIPETLTPEQQWDDDVAVRDIRAAMSRHGIWGWCQVVLTAELTLDSMTTITTSAIAGCCSYDSEKDFREGAGAETFSELRQEALDAMRRDIRYADAAFGEIRY